MLETPCWKNVSTIELIDTGLSDFALGRLSRFISLRVVTDNCTHLAVRGGPLTIP